MRAITAALLALALAACGRETSSPNIVKDAPPPTRTEPPNAQPAATAKPGASLPPASAAYRYIGRWAADVAACPQGAWRFEERKLTTAGEVACTFDKVARTAAGYDIAATCTAEAPPAPYRLSLTFAESAKAMLVEGGPFDGPIGLIWCGVA
jgi:hypothetical protein